MNDCVVILLLAVGFGVFNLLGHRIGEAPGSGGWIPRYRFPRGFKFMMVLNWTIFAMAVFGGFACIYQRFH